MLIQDAKILLDAIAGALESQKYKPGRKKVLNEWEIAFLKSIEVLIEKEKNLSDAQGKKLEEIYRRMS